MTFRLVSSDRLRRALVVLTLCGLARTQAGAAGAPQFLEPEQAFVFSARVLDERRIEIGFDVAPGYYLYRAQFKFAASGAALGTALIPTGQVKFDETFQKDVETHRGRVRIVVPVQQAPPAFKLSVESQGCADKGLCYPPDTHTVEVRLRAFGGDGTLRKVASP